MFKRIVDWSAAFFAFGLIGNLSALDVLAQPPTIVWRPLAIGAGGQLTGIDIAPDGTKVVKADAFGAYIWNETTGRWDQVITALSQGAMATSGTGGVWEIRIAPSQPNRLYMIVNGYTYRSDDRGNHWLKTSLSFIANSVSERKKAADANGLFKFANQKMAIDPANPNVVYVGTPANGVWRTFDAGVSWKRVAEIPGSTLGPGSAGIAFDPHSGKTNGNTNTIFVPSYGKGVWQSKDAGATWTQIANGIDQNGPLNVWTAQIGADGVYWCSDHVNVWKYQYYAWTAIRNHTRTHSMSSIIGVAVDPNEPGRVVFVTDSASSGYETLDNGVSLVGNDRWAGKGYPGAHTAHSATDIPWLQNSDTNYMTLGDARFDPTQNNKLYFSEGIGVWWTNWPKTFSGSPYYSQSAGIEELVANDIIAPAGGKPLVGVWDRGVFRSDNPDVYPTRYYLIDGAFTAGWALDYASADSTFVVALNNWPGNYKSGFSNDSGQNWHLFGKQPDILHHAGCIAAATALNMIVVPANNGAPLYTKDGGNSWRPLAGNGSSGQLPNDGWVFAYYLHRYIVAADRVMIGTFYLYNYIHGVYRTTDGGENWSLVHRGPVAFNSAFNARLRSAPGHAGHLWFTAGGGNGAQGNFMRSIDGGINWRAVPKVLNVIDFGFGKSKSATGYPTIFIVGNVNGLYGIWRSDDQAASWINLGTNPNNTVDYIKTINGDMNTFGKVYVGFGGSGFSYGELEQH